MTMAMLDTKSSALPGMEDQAMELDMKSQMSNLAIGVPTNDLDVRNLFRVLYEPITLFGEGNFERRERLKAVLLATYERTLYGKNIRLAVATDDEAKRFYNILKTYHIDMSNVFNKKALAADYPAEAIEESIQEPEERELFYTEGDEFVTTLRKEIAQMSWERTLKRKAVIHCYRNKCDQFEHNDDVDRYGNFITENLCLSYSQLASDRPLTMARFSPNMKHIAVGSFCAYINLYDYTNNAYPQSKRLNNGSKEMVHCLNWNNCWLHPCYKKGAKDKEIPDEHLILATGGSGGTVSFWKPFTKEAGAEEEESGNCCILSSALHESKVNRILFHPNEKYVASTSADETIRIYDLERRAEVYIQEGHSHAVYALGIAGDGNLMASGDIHGVLLIFDLRTGKHVFQQPMHNADITAIDFHPLNQHTFATSSCDNTVKIYDLRKLRVVTSLLAHTKLVSDVQFEPIYGRFIATSSFDSMVKVWDTREYKCRKVLPNDDARVMGLHVAPDTSAIVSVGYDRMWRLFKYTNEPNNRQFSLHKALYG